MPIVKGHVIYGKERFDIRISRSSIDVRSLSPEEMQDVDIYIRSAERHLERLTRGPTAEDRYVSNGRIFRQDWLTPTITGPVVEFDDPRGEYQYYLTILNAMKDIRQHGYVTRGDDSLLVSLGAPDNLLLDPDAEVHTIIA